MKRRFLKSGVILLAFTMMVACNDKKKTGKTTPGLGGDGAGGGEVQPGLGSGSAKPKIKLTKEEKKSYEKAVATYLEAAKTAEKEGEWKGGTCREPAQAFAAVASGNPRLFTYGKHNEAITWLHCGEKDKAIAAFNAALGKNSNFSPSLVSMGYLKAERGDMEGAYRNFERAFVADMRNAEASYNLGVYYREKQKSGAQLTPAEKERFRNLKTPQGHYAYRQWITQKIIGQKKKLDYKELALRHLRTVLAITSGSEEPNARLLNLNAYTMIALVYTDGADKMRSQLALANLVVQEAEKLIGEYSERVEKEKLPPLCQGKNPTPMDKAVAELRNVQGLMALKKKEKDLVSGMKSFTEAVSCDPDFWEAHMNIGAIALSFRGYDRAKASFEVVLKEKKDHPDAVMGLGVAFRGLSALAMADAKDEALNKAKEKYEKVMSLAKPQDKIYADALYNLGLLYQDYMSGTSDEDNRARLKKAQSYYEKYANHPKTVKEAKKDAISRAKDITRTFKIMEQMDELQKKQEERERRLKEQQKNQKEEEKNKESAPNKAAPRPR